MDLISIFSFLKEHIYNGGFIQMKMKQPPTTILEWFTLYEKEFGEMTTNLYTYMQQKGVTEQDKLIIQNLLHTYLSKINDDFYKVISKDDEKRGDEQEKVEKRETEKKYTNILYQHLYNFNNDILDDIDRYLKVAIQQKSQVLNKLPSVVEESLNVNSANNIYTSIQEKQPEKKLSIREIALLCYYQNIKVNANNAITILEPYGHKSGTKLNYQFDLLNDSEIITHRYSVKNLENIIPLLQGSYKERAEKDLISAENHKKLKK